jgi:hypothetical protein
MISEQVKKHLVSDIYKKQLYIPSDQKKFVLLTDINMKHALLNKESVLNVDSMLAISPVYFYKFTTLDYLNLDIMNIDEPFFFISHYINQSYIYIVKYRLLNFSDDMTIKRIFEDETVTYLNIDKDMIIKQLNELFVNIEYSFEDFNKPELYNVFLFN